MILAEYADILRRIVTEPIDAFDEAVRLAMATRARGGVVFFIGNGGSAAIASHMAADWQKAAGVPSMCFNDAAAVTALANDVGYDKVFTEPLRIHAGENDVLFAISSSGRSASILSAAGLAAQMGLKVVTLSGFDSDNPLRGLGDLDFYVPSERYGVVETTHLAICHSILDALIDAIR